MDLPSGAWDQYRYRADRRVGRGHRLRRSAAFALWIAVATWVAGFDMLYALLDVDSDRATGIHSVPVRFGEHGALIGCRIMHAISVAAMVATGLLVHAGTWYAIGVGVCAVILLWENIAVRDGDRRAVQLAFGVANGVVAFVYFAFVLVEVVTR